jgi:hypothetical protein
MACREREGGRGRQLRSGYVTNRLDHKRWVMAWDSLGKYSRRRAGEVVELDVALIPEIVRFYGGFSCDIDKPTSHAVHFGDLELTVEAAPDQAGPGHRGR